MKKIILVLLFLFTFIFIKVNTVSANNSCGSKTYGDCPANTSFYCSAGPWYAVTCCPYGQSCPFCGGTYYGECPNGGGFACYSDGTAGCCASGSRFCSNTQICLSTSLDCNNYVKCNGSNYYCPTGQPAVCVSKIPACTPTGYDSSTATNCSGSVYFCKTGETVQCSPLGCIVPTPTPTPTPTPATLPAPLTGEVLDQQQPNNGGSDFSALAIILGSNGAAAAAQTFTSGGSGNLNRVAFSINSLSGSGGTLKVGFSPTDQNVPTGTPTSEVLIPQSSLTTGTRSVTFNPAPALVEGQKYAIRFGNDVPSGGSSQINLSGYSNCIGCDFYPRGALLDYYQSWGGNQGADLFFGTYMTNFITTATPTPTPSPTPTPTPTPTPAPTLPPQESTGEAPTTYTIAPEVNPGTQGANNFYYYWRQAGTAIDQLATYRQAQMCMGTCSDSSVQTWQLGQKWFGEADNLYWTTADGYSWMAVDPDKNTAGDNEIAVIFWKAPKQGTAAIKVTEKRIEDLNKGNGFTFGIGYTSAVGQESNNFTTDSIPSSEQNVIHPISNTYQMRGGGDALYYFKISNGTTGDTSAYTISITFTPTKDAPSTTPTPQPVTTSSNCQSAADSATARVINGLISVGDTKITGIFSSTNGQCILDRKAAFAPFNIPSFDTLKSLYYTQK